MSRSRMSRFAVVLAGVFAAAALAGPAQAGAVPPDELTGLVPGPVGEVISKAVPPQPPAAPRPVAPAEQAAPAPTAPAPTAPSPPASPAAPPAAPAPTVPPAEAQPSGAGAASVPHAKTATAGQPADTGGAIADAAGAADQPPTSASTADLSELEADGDETSLPFTGFRSLPAMLMIATLALMSGFVLRRALRRAG